MRIGVGISILAGTALLLAASQVAAVDQWPDTGQAKCYDQDGIEIVGCGSVTYPGQDADFSGPGRDLTADADTVIDGLTGLMWVKDVSSAVEVDLAGADAAISVLNGTGGFAGYTDWRLPTAKELATIVDNSVSYNGTGGAGSNIYADHFVFPVGVYSPVFWSSTPDAGDSASATDRMVLNVRFGTIVGTYDASAPITAARVLAVRP